jgi:TatD DNase family protein
MLVDSHCHLDYPGLAEDPAAVIERAEAVGVGLLLTISTRVREFEKIRTLIENHAQVYGSVGTHPNNASEETDVTAEQLIALSQHPKIVAIGEAGLDYHYDYAKPEDQQNGFRAHIAAARETGLPLIIHARSADEDMIRILEEETQKGAFPAILHCFSSGAGLARRGVELGLYVSFSGILTFKGSHDIRVIAAEVPQDRLLVETDAPFLAPMPHRGKPNEPAYVAHTAKTLGEVRGWTLDETARITTDNFRRLFSKIPDTAWGAS